MESSEWADSRDFIKYGAPTPSTQEIEKVYKEWHPEIGARLMKQWQLPEALEHPVRFHHDPESCPSHKGQAIVAYVANRLAHRYGFGCTADSADLLEDAICTKVGPGSTRPGSATSIAVHRDCSRSHDKSSPRPFGSFGYT